MQVEDFGRFFEAVRACPPFPWQERLVRQVVATRSWPHTISIPTGCGKTSLLDIAVFLLALDADRSERMAAMRTFLVVDRRLIVDEAERQAQHLADALDGAQFGILAEVASRLRSFAPKALAVAKLRGGMAFERPWCDSPCQPMLIATTVDQIGSRLLFRGYGCSETRRAIDAGLVGNDALIILDEAHLSNPFLGTLSAVQQFGARIEWVQMSATPRDATKPFTLDSKDLKHPVLAARLGARKLARLRKCTDLVGAAVDAAEELSANARVVGVIVNRVDTARQIFERLRRRAGSEAVLLIGRIRPFERDRLLESWLPRMKAGRDRSHDEPLFVVATQTVEVGADLDFDALVSEAAPLDVLRQRFGRLDRLGEIGTTEAVILRGPEDFAAYGSATDAAWSWVSKAAKGKAPSKTIDFCVLAIDKQLRDRPSTTVMTPSVSGPVLLPAHLEAWCQTTAVPDVDPAVAPFLHGPEAFDSDEVQIVWRGDLEQDWIDAVAVAPPQIQETMSVPRWMVRNWLGRRPALVWRGLDDALTRMVSGAGLRPGDTIIVPTSYGGSDEFGWKPESDAAVADIGDLLGNWIRLHPAFLDPQAAAQVARLIRADEIDTAAVEQLLISLGMSDANIDVGSARKYDSGIIVRRVRDELADTDAASVSEAPVLLSAHSAGVEKYAQQFAAACGLAAEEVEAAMSVSRAHDLGKFDPRFQAILFGGDIIEAYRAIARGEALAKSGAAWTLSDYRRYRAVAAYPNGARHEAASMRVAEQMGAGDLALHLIAAHHGKARPSMPWWSDENGLTVEVRVDGNAFAVDTGASLGDINSPVIDRFWALCSKYGFWRVAYLEAILKLADYVQSRSERNG